MPKKYFHIVTCPLSKRQRFLYEDYIGRRNTREQLASGSFLSMMGVLMQLRKVCNHPDLFETRPITTPFICDAITIRVPKMVYQLERGVVFSHSLNHFCEQTDLTDEALESADWRRSLLIFPSFCRRVCLVNDERLVDREEDSLGAAIMRTSLQPPVESFVQEILTLQKTFSPSSPLIEEVENTVFHYRFFSSPSSHFLAHK